MTKENEKIQIGEVFQQSKQNAEQIAELRHTFSEVAESLRDSIDRLGTRLTESTKPNFGTIWCAIGVSAAILLGVGGIVAGGFQRDMARQDSENAKVDARHVLAEEKLDERLQREMRQINSTVEERIAAVRVGDENRHMERLKLFEQLDKRVSSMEAWNTAQIKSDLDELRQRRLNGTKQ